MNVRESDLVLRRQTVLSLSFLTVLLTEKTDGCCWSDLLFANLGPVFVNLGPDSDLHSRISDLLFLNLGPDFDRMLDLILAGESYRFAVRSASRESMTKDQ